MRASLLSSRGSQTLCKSLRRISCLCGEGSASPRAHTVSKHLRVLQIHFKRSQAENQVSKALFPKIVVFETGSAITGTMATQIISLIKKTQVPIIINCNDPYPLKTLANYCLPIKLKRPTKIRHKERTKVL